MGSISVQVTPYNEFYLLFNKGSMSNQLTVFFSGAFIIVKVDTLGRICNKNLERTYTHYQQSYIKLHVSVRP